MPFSDEHSGKLFLSAPMWRPKITFPLSLSVCLSHFQYKGSHSSRVSDLKAHSVRKFDSLGRKKDPSTLWRPLDPLQANPSAWFTRLTVYLLELHNVTLNFRSCIVMLRKWIDKKSYGLTSKHMGGATVVHTFALLQKYWFAGSIQVAFPVLCMCVSTLRMRVTYLKCLEMFFWQIIKNLTLPSE